MNDPSLIDIMRRNLALYIAIAASDAAEIGDDDLAEQLYSASIAYELSRRE